MFFSIVFLTLLSILSPIYSDNPLVTCGSVIKLGHVPTSRRLHSHDVPYGSGSGQQSVTAFPDPGDTNSYWVVLGPLLSSPYEKCPPGTALPHNGIIRLKHMSTGRHLHSHLHKSPLSKNQEVSCFHGEDTGDHWRVVLSSGQHWKKQTQIRLQHVDTKMYLSTNPRYVYGRPIPGQGEVACIGSSRDKNAFWRVEEGVFREEEIEEERDEL